MERLLERMEKDKMETEKKKTISIEIAKLRRWSYYLVVVPLLICAFVGIVTFLAAFPAGAIILIGLFCAGIVSGIKLNEYGDAEEAPQSRYEK